MKTLKSRYFLASSVLAVAAAVGIVVFFPPWEEDLFTDRHFDLLSEGMTREEVTKIMGGPAGDYSKGTGGPYHYGWDERIDSFSLPPPKEIRDAWYGPYGAIECQFDDKGRLQRKYLYGTYNPPPPTIWKRLKAWLDSWTEVRIEILA